MDELLKWGYDGWMKEIHATDQRIVDEIKTHAKCICLVARGRFFRGSSQPSQSYTRYTSMPHVNYSIVLSRETNA